MNSVEAVSSQITSTSDEATRVRSVSEDLRKVSLDLSASVEDFLKDVTADVDERRASLRVRTREAVDVTADGKHIATAIRDISDTGASIDVKDGLAIGTNVTLEWADGRRVEAKVVRVGDGYAGVKFATPASGLARHMAA